ncbi:MAG: hypothetical protein V5A64_01320 [Candidatus Thermoplasmatota archaeon]
MSLQYNKSLRSTFIILVIITFTLSQTIITSSDNKTTDINEQNIDTSFIKGNIEVKVTKEEKLIVTPKINITDKQKIILNTTHNEEKNIIDNTLKIKLKTQRENTSIGERPLYIMSLLYREEIDSILDIKPFQSKITQKAFLKFQKINISTTENIDIPITFETTNEKENTTLFMFIITKPSTIHFLKNPFFDFSKSNIKLVFNSSYKDTTPPTTECKIEKK